MALVLLIFCKAGSGDLVRNNISDTRACAISGLVDTTEESESLELEDDDALVDHTLDPRHVSSSYSFLTSGFFASNQFRGDIIIPPPQG